MKQLKILKIMILSAACALFVVAPGAIANAASPLAGIATFSGIGVGAPTGKACTITGTSGANTFDCSIGAQGSPLCPCTEYEGLMKGTGVGANNFVVLDLIQDLSAYAEPTTGTYILVPSPAGPIPCVATTGIGLMLNQKQAPILLFTVGGFSCPTSETTGSFSGSYSIINPLLATEGLTSPFPNASGSGAISSQYETGVGISFGMTGILKKK